MFGSSLRRGSDSQPEINQLLLILSDGRGVFSDGVQVRMLSTIVCSSDICHFYFQSIENAMRRLNDIGVFTVFVVLDSLSKVLILVFLAIETC